jgi:hypothetical protein
MDGVRVRNPVPCSTAGLRAGVLPTMRIGGWDGRVLGISVGDSQDGSYPLGWYHDQTLCVCP